LLAVGLLVGLIGYDLSKGHLLFDWIGLCLVLVSASLYLVARFRQRKVGPAD
jgi:uncharacterized membrane protein